MKFIFQQQHVGVAGSPKKLQLMPISDNRNFSFGFHPNHVIFVVADNYYKIACLNTYVLADVDGTIQLNTDFDHDRFVQCIL